MSTKKMWCICSRFADVTESAAIAAAEWTGRGDALAASLAARQAMAVDLAEMPLRAGGVAGRGGDPSSDTLSVGGEVGLEVGPWATASTDGGPWSEEPETWALAVDPLQAPNSLARGADGALAMVAAGPLGSLMPVPEMYMQKLVVPSEAVDAIDLDALVGENVKGVAAALGRRPQDLSVIVLDRPRHEDLIAQIRDSGASVRLVSDGDVSAGLAVASPDVEVDMCIGIGGSTEGILTAAAIRCLGGEMQARFWPVSRHQVELVRAAGIEDIEARLTTIEMAGDGVLFVATAVTGGRFLKPVAHHADGIHTETLVLCSRCRSVRKIHSIRRPESGGPQVALGAR